MKLIKFKNFKDKRGDLFFNFYNDFKFKVKRIYFIKNFNNQSRGNHARRFGRKLYICIHGSLIINIENKIIKKNFLLKTGDSIKVEKNNWVSIKGNKTSICLVLDSLEYNEKHYIREKKIFLKKIGKIKK